MIYSLFKHPHDEGIGSGFKLETLKMGGGGLNMDELEGAEFGSFENSRSGNSSMLNQSQNNQQQAQIQMESDVNMSQLREREAALRRLESDIVDVNMIFKDLAIMVHDQGEIIDSIESNVEAVQIRVTEANSHLESAKKLQVSRRFTTAYRFYNLF